MKSFAILPAAGESRRMQRPKLLLPWQGTTIIDQVLGTWRRSRVTTIVLVARADDSPLRDAASRAEVDVALAPEATPDMKASVRIGLRHVAEHYQPDDNDAWLLAPADMPRLTTTTIDLLLQARPSHGCTILVPTYRGRRGHPVLLPWTLAGLVDQLPDSAGINRLLQEHPVQEIETDEHGILDDLDTPEDYIRLRHAPPIL